ncbi:MAG TPA: DNA polymerase Y family protein [Tepidisphaeraceae bacterium]|nr:DNA polymerase Y family protein [Tepidisphaeraceae bacterium]
MKRTETQADKNVCPTDATTPPIVLTRTVAERQLVVGACDAARAAGVRGGMTLAQARALCPGLTHADHDPAGDARALEALGRWLMARFSPTVQCGTDDPEGRVGLFVDVSGTGRLLGPPEQVAEQIVRALRRMRVTARVAVAPTPGAAWALTFREPTKAHGTRSVGSAPDTCTVVSTRDLSTALAPLPVCGLRIDTTTLATLHHLGIDTVGRVLALPRDMLPARFGPALGWRLDQALGRAAEPLVPLVYQSPVEAGVDFDGVIDSLEALWASFRELIDRVVADLTRRGAGARKLLITFCRPYAPAVEKTIELSTPCRDPRVLFNLVRCAMETVGEIGGRKRKRFKVLGEPASAGGSRQRSTPSHPQSSVSHQGPPLRPSAPLHLDPTGFVPSGFVGLRLAVPAHERTVDAQTSLTGEDDDAGGLEALARLTERLTVKLGDGALVAVDPVESYIPERAFKPSRIADRGSRIEKRTLRSPKAKPRKSAVRIPQSEIVPTHEPAHRPLLLYPVPREARVMVRPSHDLDGAPISFALDGRHRRIVHAVGPERLAGAWWLGRDKTRDYFDVEDDAGRRWWLFRVAQTSRWFVHGEFE